MSFERLIARRFLQRGGDNFSRPLVNIATYTIAIGVVVMLIAMSVLRGFQNEITEKVVGFGSHITLRSYGWVNDYDEIPVKINAITVDGGSPTQIESIPNIKCVQPFAYKGGMMKTDEQIQGIVFKGVDSRFDTTFFAQNLVKGRFFNLSDTLTSNEIIISQRMADKMGLDTGSKARTYFWVGDNYRARAFTIVGIYNTDLSEFDDHYMLGDIRQVQKLNGWDSTQVGGVEILVNDFKQLDKSLDDVAAVTRPDISITSIRDGNQSMFAWLDLLNSNIILILVIMGIVCATSVVSALLIMIFEKTSMIGLLKTIGSTNKSIRKIFMIKALRIVGVGIIVGNVIALILCLVQANFHLLKLDSESYSMSFVPIEINAWFFLLISAATLIVCMLALLLPSKYIAHIDPAKSIRKE